MLFSFSLFEMFMLKLEECENTSNVQSFEPSTSFFFVRFFCNYVKMTYVMH